MKYTYFMIKVSLHYKDSWLTVIICSSNVSKNSNFPEISPKFQNPNFIWTGIYSYLILIIYVSMAAVA